VDDRVIWVCGSEGTAGISTDAGISCHWITVAHYEKSDFRDVEAFSDQEAVIMPHHHYSFVSGRKRSALYMDSSGYFPLLLVQGKETTGANSMAIDPTNANQAYITGGDFSRDGLDSGNALGIRFHPFQQRAEESAT